jgi:hypothetical protein
VEKKLELMELVPLLDLNLELVEVHLDCWQQWPCHEAVNAILLRLPRLDGARTNQKSIRICLPPYQNPSAHEKTPENKHPEIRYEYLPSSPGPDHLRCLTPASP